MLYIYIKFLIIMLFFSLNYKILFGILKICILIIIYTLNTKL
jgi:hypothetical protein